MTRRSDERGSSPSEALARARSLIARHVHGAIPDEPSIGTVTLWPHQKRALARVRELLSRHGGALLADDVGMGKTYVALAIARRYKQVLVLAPASLRTSWECALQRTHVQARVESLERLSRATVESLECNADLVIVDEAHHVRTPTTRRYTAVAALADRSHVLLLSATPVQNRRTDLVAPLALFLGDRAYSMSDDELARFVVRHAAREAPGQLPEIDGPYWIRIPCDDDLLDELLGLPPPVPGSDEGSGGALVAYTLLRQWASSHAALVEAVRRRIARSSAMLSSLESGRRPSRRELAAWTYAEGTLQLAFPELVASAASVKGLGELLAAVRMHEAALHGLLARTQHTTLADDARAAVLRRLRARHPGARMIAFSQFAETVRALARRLLADGGVAELTARGARVVGGRITREEVLAQFAPGGANRTPASERIDLLITTDVLSEGLDLQEATVIVHLDLPWNPARLEQRVGRARRMGSSHPLIFTYALAPPAASERVLRVEQRLRQKLGIAAELVGIGSRILPRTERERDSARGAERNSETLTLLRKWIDESPRADVDVDDIVTMHRPVVAAVRARHEGMIALLNEDGDALLIADLGCGLTRDASRIHEAVKQLTNPAVAAADEDVGAAIDRLTRWWHRRRGRRSLGLHTPAAARVRARLSARIDEVLSRVARHDRARIGPLASRARQVLRASVSAAAERSLAHLADTPTVDASWLSAVVAIADGRVSTIGVVEPRDGPLASARDAPSIPLLVLVLLRECESRPPHD